MIISVILVFFNFFVIAFNFILIARIVASWVVVDMTANWMTKILLDLTEPVLGPVRKILPQGGMIDLAPMVTILGLYAVRELVVGLLFR
jgi:YggT family protein